MLMELFKPNGIKCHSVKINKTCSEGFQCKKIFSYVEQEATTILKQ